MKKLEEKKDCLITVLKRYKYEFTIQIDALQSINKEDDYDVFFDELCVLVSKEHNDILPELQFCQNSYGPTETQIININ